MIWGGAGACVCELSSLPQYPLQDQAALHCGHEQGEVTSCLPLRCRCAPIPLTVVALLFWVFLCAADRHHRPQLRRGVDAGL